MLAVQARRVRQTALLLPEPEGARTGSAGSGSSLRLLIVGDSSAAGVGAQTQSEALSGQLVHHLSQRYSVSWRLEACTGHATQDSIDRLMAIPPQLFDIAVIALGVNDVTQATTKAQFRRQQALLWALLQTRFGIQQILSSGVPQMQYLPLLPQPLAWVVGKQAARLDRVLEELAANTAMASHIPMRFSQDPSLAASDGFHPSPAAYTLWATTLADHIP
ncbi:SGNH/GDSL hydrolase family protein [Parasedimentitalea marina]|uniref:SGNH/GDSL hydrolase family protein n=1 Tax=Parasedimentitalea marina TaxID=2483033 RepID=UPI001EE83602|nr:SGNH/GDSL hydrolase family protein [Parasedimentitalea marina]